MNTLDKILALLKEQGKKQKDLMDYLGMGKTAFTGWKSGANKSYYKYIAQIAEFFDVSTDYLVGKTNIRKSEEEKMVTYSFEGEQGTGEQGINSAQLNELNKLITAAKELPPEKLAALIQVAENMK